MGPDRETLVDIMQILSSVSKGSGLAKRTRSQWSAIYYVDLRLRVIENAC